MCTEEKFHALERKVGSIDERVIKIETTIDTKFDEIGAQLQTLIDERKQWSDWLRHALGKALRLVAVIILAACGINQASKIVSAIIPVMHRSSTSIHE